MSEESSVNYFPYRLSDETLLEILKCLLPHHDSLVSLSQTCTKLERLLRDKVFCEKVIITWHAQLSRGSLSVFLKDRVRAPLISVLDLSDVYWIPSGILRDLILNMENLSTLLLAGTSCTWPHLAQILSVLKGVQKLSWSWDNGLEDSCRRRSSVSPLKFAELTEMKEVFERLTALLLHIPMMAKVPTDVLFYSYSALEWMISLARNLEDLWIMSWPKTPAERKKSSSSWGRLESGLEGRIFLPRLRNLVISVKGPPRISGPGFFSQLLQTVGVGVPGGAKTVWVDHPLVGMRERGGGARGNQRREGLNFGVQLLCAERAQRLSYPIMAFPDAARETFNYPELKHVLICHGQPVVVNLNGFFDKSPKLESFYCSAFNSKMDWKRFASIHPNLKALSVSEVQGIEDNCDSVAFSKFRSMRRLSVPIDILFEIRDPKALAEYAVALVTDSKTEDLIAEAGKTERLHKNSSHAVGFKRRRVGAATKPSSNGKTNAVSGLDFVSVGCHKIQELEIGYGVSSKTKAGRILSDSLFSLCKFRSLRKLSLNALPIYNGKFLIEVLQACPIESLRLTHLGPSAKCCYMSDLCLALTKSKRLHGFRLEQNYIGSPGPLLTALQHCKDLQRVLIWSSPNDKPLEYSPVNDLFSSCLQLIAFYATIESTTKIDCFKIRKAIEEKFKHKRPALSIILRRTLEEEEVIQYPSIHYRQMVVNNTQVCQFTDFSGFNNNGVW